MDLNCHWKKLNLHMYKEYMHVTISDILTDSSVLYRHFHNSWYNCNDVIVWFYVLVCSFLCMSSLQLHLAITELSYSG